MSLEDTPKSRKSDGDGRPPRLFALKWDPAVALCRDPAHIWKELTLLEDGRTVRGHLGYGLARCTRGFVDGCWYYEVTVHHRPEEGNCRVGWVQPKRESQLQAYPGFDEWGYGYRDKEGTYFHQARACGGGQPYSSGDVVGCLLLIPPDSLADAKEQALLRVGVKDEYDAVRAKICAEGDRVTQLDVCGMETVVPDSKVVFFKNGIATGVAFEGVRHGLWFPAVGLYRGGRVTVNFGPQWRCPPQLPDSVPTPRPISELRRLVVLSLSSERGPQRGPKRRRCDPDAKHFLF
eukprot:EG_transcript_19510